ncbi:SRPBCC family protein [Herbiconiux solani]|uniref:SRPBCC family protein n=1 Tax=Herbiconiux solani TaxID=661329 RepID=UPI0008255A4E|nr:SRPBCC family protein [Herbiconiux solani]
MEFVEFSVIGDTAVDAQRAFDRVVPRDDSTLFHRFLVIPAVTGVSEQTGPWTRPGEQRTVHLSDGSRFREHLVRYDRPPAPDARGRFDYDVTDYTKVLGRLVSDARARWEFAPAAGGSTIRWSYGFRPLPRRRALVARVIGPIWMAYMRRGLAECIRVAEGGA